MGRCAPGFSGLAVLALVLSAAFPALAAKAPDAEALGFERTPPRLSFTDGEVSFWRPGASEWTPARVNMPLAAGDELYTASSANLEVQIGSRAYLRAGEDAQLGLTNLEPDFLQLRVTAGQVSLDLRSLGAGQTLEVDTPNAAFTIEHIGYYRVGVEGEATTFTSRRGGRASLTPASGTAAAIESSEQVVVTGSDTPTVETYSAPEFDAWDRWNYARTDDLIEAVSARYVSPGVYGVADLDHYGDWRLVPTYGAVWVPHGVTVGWVPYSNGRWVYDPFYGWTWVDDAPWGWAPYHYGRWVYVSGFWGWCPGPIVARPYYAPALVAFYGGGGFSIGVTLGTPRVGWVALGWGEPVLPWWGPPAFRGHPYWAGWGGPHVVNDVVVKRTTVITARDIHFYDHAQQRDAIVTVPRDRFGRREGGENRFSRAADPKQLGLLGGDVSVRPDRSSLVAALGSAPRPPRRDLDRTVVATRPPQAEMAPGLEPRRAARESAAAPQVPPPARVVASSQEGRRRVPSERPPFGSQGQTERRITPPVPRFEELRRSEAAAPTPPRAAPGPRGAPATPREGGGKERTVPEAPAARHERASAPSPQLPGEPANRVWHPSSRAPRQPERAMLPPQERPPASPERMATPQREGSRQGGAPQEHGASHGPRRH